MRYSHHIKGIAFLFLLSATTTAFNPRDYDPLHHTVKCRALNRKEGRVKNIALRYVDINNDPDVKKETILMVHGWPSLWSSWKNQIEEFKNEYRLLVPDLRGFGSSEHPGDVKSSGTMGDLVGDLACILENAKIGSGGKVICMGHDWGSQVCYEAARMRPDLISAVVGVAVPYIPSAGHFTPVSDLTHLLPRLAYQLYFDSHTSDAIKELNSDIRRTLRATLRTVDSPPPDGFLKSNRDFLDAYRELKEIPRIPFFSDQEEEYWVEQFAIQGFQSNLQFYMHNNRYEGWRFSNEQGNHTIPQHVLAVYPNNDPVADWTLVSHLPKSASFIPNLTVRDMEGAHWPHLEFPEEFNRVLRAWLVDLSTKLEEEQKCRSNRKGSRGEKEGRRATDEL